MLPETIKLRDPPPTACSAPRSQLRNSSTRCPPPCSRSIRLRKIGNSSRTSSTGLSCVAHSPSSCPPKVRQLPASSPARILTPKSCALTSSTLSLIQWRIPVASLDEIDRTGCTASARLLTTSSAQIAPSISAKRKTQPLRSSRPPSSRAMLVLPMRRCPVSSTWLRSRTRASKTCNSRSRPKKSSPLTQRPVDDLIAVLFRLPQTLQYYSTVLLSTFLLTNLPD